MALPVRTYGDGILIIAGDFVRGQNAGSGSGSAGSVLNLRGGDGDGVGNAGGVLIDGGAAGASAGADGGSVTIQGTSPTGNNSTGGGVSISAGNGDALGLSSSGGAVSFSGGNGGSSGAGGSVDIAAGNAGTSNSNGGSVTLTAKARTGVGSDGSIALQATRSGTTDDAVVSIDTENGSFAGSEWNHMTVGVEASASSGTTTVLAITGPSSNGENMKLRIWATASDVTSPAAQLSQILEVAYRRSGGSTSQFSALHQNSIINDGGWAIGNVVTTSISGTTINVQITVPLLTATRWMLEVDWQVGGMAA